MKVLFPVPDPNRTVNNHYVYSLCNALCEQGVDAICTLDGFWSEAFFDYDIIHFQWPETLFRWKICHRNNDIEKLILRLAQAKELGKRIFLTCHNIRPHEIKDDVALRLYDVLYKFADVFVHMGNYSKEVLEKEYPGARHIIVPHHIYDNVYSMDVPKLEARKKLGLSPDKLIVLCFGAFRNDEEREMLMEVKTKLKSHHIEFVAPGFYRQKLFKRPLSQLPIKLYKRWYYRMKGVKFSNSMIADCDLPLYFCAADIVLIQRLEILNSGNLAMAFHAGKMVVGPDTGNVGRILKETGNITFDPTSKESVTEFVLRASQMPFNEIGVKNKEYAYTYMTSEVVAHQLADEYQI